MAQDYIYGRNTIIEAIYGEKALEKIFLQYGVSGPIIDKIRFLAQKNNINCTLTDTKKFNGIIKEYLPKGANHQGVVALLEQVKTLTLDDMLLLCTEVKNPILIVLDGITDPHNLGATARSAECAGATGLIIPKTNAAPITTTAIKTSAGALLHLPVCKVFNIIPALEKLKEEGFTIISTDSDADALYTEIDYNKPVVIVIGSEGKGIRSIVKSKSTQIIKIPMLGKIESLNASVSSAVIMFEIVRQRMKKGKKK